MSNITFNVSQEWFDKYKSGDKRKEFRAITEYWVKRLIGKLDNSKNDWGGTAWMLAELLKNESSLDLSDRLKRWRLDTIMFDTVTICVGYPAKDDHERRITYKYLSTTIGYAEAGIGKELMGDERVFVIEMEDL